jgi:hypothetical protein
VSPLVGATVEDIKAAAATYLGITNAWNAALDVNKKTAKSTQAPSVPASWRSAAGALSSADTKAAAQLRAYTAWPQSVKMLIDQIIAQYVISADNDHQQSAATSWEQWNGVSGAANNEGARLSTLIRQALGLPQRATS